MYWFFETNKQKKPYRNMHLAEDPRFDMEMKPRVTYISVLVNALLFQNGLISITFTEHSRSSLTLSGDQRSPIGCKMFMGPLPEQVRWSHCPSVC